MNGYQAHAGVKFTATMMMAALFGMALTNLFVRSSMGVLAPELASDLDLSPFILGAIASAFFFAYALFQIPGGMLLDRFGPRRVIVGLFFFTALGTLAFSFAPNGITMLIARVVMGIGCAAIFSGAFMLITRFYPSDRLTSIAGSMNSFAMLGMLLATFPLAYLVTVIGWRDGFTLIAIAALVLTAFSAFVIRDWPDAPQTTGTSDENLHQIFDGVREALKTRNVLKISSAGISLSTGSLFLGLWGGPYLYDVHSLTETERGKVLMFMAFGGVTGHFLFGRMARVLNTLKGIVLFGSGLATGVMGIMALWMDPSRLTVTLLFVVLGFACGFPSILLAHARAIMPDRLIGRGIAVVNTGIMISIALMQTAVGIIINFSAGPGLAPDAESYQLVFSFLAVMAFASFLIYASVDDQPPRI